MRRALILLSVVAAVLTATTGPASAKTPPFTVEVSDPTPDAGEVVTVIVRMWNRLNPRVPDTLYRPPGGELDGLLALVAAEDMESGRPRPRSPQEPIELRYVRPATFQGSFVAPEHGDHWVVPWPRVLLSGAQEGTTAVAVRDTGGSPWVVPVGAVAVAVAGAGVVGTVRWRRRSSSSADACGAFSTS